MASSFKTFLHQTAHKINLYLDACPDHIRDNKAHKDVDNLLNLICRISTVHADDQFASISVTNTAPFTEAPSTEDLSTEAPSTAPQDGQSLAQTLPNKIRTSKCKSNTVPKPTGAAAEVKDAWKNRGKKKPKDAAAAPMGMEPLVRQPAEAKTDDKDTPEGEEDAKGPNGNGEETEGNDEANDSGGDAEDDLDSFPSFKPFADKHRLKHMLPLFINSDNAMDIINNELTSLWNVITHNKINKASIRAMIKLLRRLNVTWGDSRTYTQHPEKIDVVKTKFLIVCQRITQWADRLDKKFPTLKTYIQPFRWLAKDWQDDIYAEAEEHIRGQSSHNKKPEPKTTHAYINPHGKKILFNGSSFNDGSFNGGSFNDGPNGGTQREPKGTSRPTCGGTSRPTCGGKTPRQFPGTLKKYYEIEKQAKELQTGHTITFCPIVHLAHRRPCSLWVSA
jgi:hypothetical protein